MWVEIISQEKKLDFIKLSLLIKLCFFINFNIATVTMIVNLWIKYLEQSCIIIKPFGKCFRDRKVPVITLQINQFSLMMHRIYAHTSARNTRSLSRLDPKGLISKFVFNERGSCTSWSRDTFTWLHAALWLTWESSQVLREFEIGSIPTACEVSGPKKICLVIISDYWTEKAKRGRRVLTEFAPAADDRAVGEPRIDCEESW